MFLATNVTAGPYDILFKHGFQLIPIKSISLLSDQPQQKSANVQCLRLIMRQPLGSDEASMIENYFLMLRYSHSPSLLWCRK